MTLGFTKMHGLGNDFVVIENMNGRISLSTEQIIFLCDRHKGIGADGVILVESSSRGDCFMNYYNSDGTPTTCGNGLRCTAKFLKDEILKSETSFMIDTSAGVKGIKLEEDGTFSVNMGKPVFSHSDFPGQVANIEGLNFHFVSMGNPHAVAFVEDLDSYDLTAIGPKVENNKIFPNKINMELVKEISPGEFTVKVWERGCGATLACGTGACAVYAIARKYKDAGKEITVKLPGGDLLLSENEKGEIIMRGPAEKSYSGIVGLA